MYIVGSNLIIAGEQEQSFLQRAFAESRALCNVRDVEMYSLSLGSCLIFCHVAMS
jgi:hypothetical protein